MNAHRMNRRGWHFYMEAKSRFLQVLAVYCCILLFSAGTSALQLNGVASYQELNNDYYLAALYAGEKQVEENWWRNADQEKKMLLVVKAAQWSSRSWFKKWQNNLAINNSLDSLSKELQQLLTEFSRLPKGDLKKGDQIEIHYWPNQGTTISLNGYPVIESSLQGLFAALVNTWIGQLPPSRLFKQQILASKESSHLSLWKEELSSIEITLERKQKTQDWYLTPEVIAKQAEEKRIEEEKRKNALKVEQARKQAEASLAKKLKVIQAKRLVEEKKQAQLAKFKKEQEARQKLQRQQQLAQEKKQRAARLLEEKERKQALVIQNQKYYKRFYEWQLQSAIRSHITYPEWARKFKEQGLIQANFDINRQGKILSIHMSEDVPSMLAAEMRRSISAVSEKIQPPKELTGDIWQFSIQHSFKFGSNKQAALVRPKKPVNL